MEPSLRDSQSRMLVLAAVVSELVVQIISSVLYIDDCAVGQNEHTLAPSAGSAIGHTSHPFNDPEVSDSREVHHTVMRLRWLTMT